MLDVGKDKGVQPGMSFEAFSQGEPVLHPVSGEVLDAGLLKTGKIQIVEVRNKISTGTVFVDSDGAVVSVGNTVESKSLSVDALAAVKKEKLGGKSIAPAGLEVIASTVVAQSGDSYSNIRKGLLSERAEDVRNAAKNIVSNSIVDETVLHTAADVLRKGYRRPGRRTYVDVDAMAWLCRVVGLSNDAEYSDLLREIFELSEFSKLRKYASESLQSMPAVSGEAVDRIMVNEGVITVVLFAHRHSYPDVYKDATLVQIDSQSLRSIPRKNRYVFQLKSGVHKIALRGAKSGWEILRLDGKAGNIYFIDTVAAPGGHDPRPVLLSQRTGMKKINEYRLKREYVEKQGGLIEEVKIGTIRLARK